MTRTRLLRDQSGATVVEFALVAPAFIGMIIGVSQLGLLYFAHSGVHHAVEEAARTALVFPKPTDDVIRASLESSRFGMAGTLVPSITDASADAGRSAIDISLSYVVPLDFIFFQTPPVTLSHTRRVFTQLPFDGVTTTPPATTPPATSPPATSPPADDKEKDKDKLPKGNGDNGKK